MAREEFELNSEMMKSRGEEELLVIKCYTSRPSLPLQFDYA